MTPAMHRLREICEGYPTPAVIDAIRLALVDDIADEGKRAMLAALVAHWLAASDEVAGPPVTGAFVDAVGRLLDARAH
jgi:hypothetical protein